MKISLLLLAPLVHADYCPNIFYQAANVILQSPFLLSKDPSLTNACHSCIANLAAKQPYAPLCYVVGMDGYDASYPIQQDCHCLSLGLTETCAQVCLPNPICSQKSVRPECSACVAKAAPSTCGSNTPWTLPCYEACQSPSCILECSPGPQCHPADTLCSSCVTKASSSCSNSFSSYGRGWGAPCTATCYSSTCSRECNRVCGDGYLTADEQCDDGNTVAGDGCSANCQVESGFVCEGSTTSQCHLGTCGDGVLEGNETCDDGNIANGDGCSSACQVELGATCSGLPSVCKATCGDGIRAVGLEQCDDGNKASGDGCSPSCKTEKGYSCTTNSSHTSVCSAVCGDGYTVPGVEGCDDGNSASYDGCSKVCQVEVGYTCKAGSSGASVCQSNCGDNIVAFPIEACDDGNHINGDGCTLDCKIEQGFNCTTNAARGSVCSAVCGDSFVATGETCDDGNSLPGDGCSNTCTIETGWSCDNTQTTAPNSVCTPICGDGLVRGWEQCDSKSSSCVNCKIFPAGPPKCGNGILEVNEQCDDGNTVSGDGCTSECKLEPGYICQETNCFGICGDGVKVSSEGCDDGNALSGDGCSATCTIETGYACTVNSSNLSACSPVCGDGKVISPEICDDANTASGDGCSATCQTEKGFSCKANSNGVSSCSGICGDGVKVATEACDDGNTKSGDGCSSSCAVERGYSCSGSIPSVCTTVCGDGIITGNEQCDVGNNKGDAGCSSTCQVQKGYQCTQPSNGGPSTCTRVPSCGDGYLSAGEQCDDGNNNSGDGCSYRCRVEALYTCTNTNNATPTTCKKSNCVNIRKDWDAHSAQEKANVMYCVNQMFQTGYYQKLTGIHVYAPNDQYAHHTNGFVQWHRKWLLMVQNVMRSLGGVCSCINLPYWDWAKDAANMQLNGCRSKLDCNPILREWGGGGSTSSAYTTVPVYNDPATGFPSSSASGYCVYNDITKGWRAGYTLGQFSNRYDASCPIIRRGWDDYNDQSGYYSSPMASSSFLSLASSLARASTYSRFIPIALGDIHVLPHDGNGAYLATFISPADPVFLLHHGNIDRVYALWEACHGCTSPSAATRTIEGSCYSGSGKGDGINDEMTFLMYDDLGNGRFNIVPSDVSKDFSEWMPQGFHTPGDMMDTTSLGDYAYQYAANSLDSQLWSVSGCTTKRPTSVMLEDHPNFVMVSSRSLLQQNATTDDTTQQYIEWIQDLLDKVNSLISSLQQSNLFSLPFAQGLLGHLASIDMYAIDVAATCECMHINKVLLNRTDEHGPSFHDISAASKRHWNNTFSTTRSCFHRLHNTNESDILQRQYCDVILNPSFEAAVESFVADMTSALQSSDVTSIITTITNYFK